MKRQHASAARLQFGIALLRPALAYVNRKMAQWKLSRSAAIERIILEHQRENPQNGAYADALEHEQTLRELRKAAEEVLARTAGLAEEKRPIPWPLRKGTPK